MSGFKRSRMTEQLVNKWIKWEIWVVCTLCTSVGWDNTSLLAGSVAGTLPMLNVNTLINKNTLKSQNLLSEFPLSLENHFSSIIFISVFASFIWFSWIKLFGGFAIQSFYYSLFFVLHSKVGFTHHWNSFWASRLLFTAAGSIVYFV